MAVTSQNDVEWVARIEDSLSQWLAHRSFPHGLEAAIGYSLLAPGKRVRPLLTVRSCEAVGGDGAQAIVAAGAVELIHTFSLVHDDLPAMDDDDMRRGRPSLHRHAGEAMAILAGDAMLGLAAELVLELVSPPELSRSVALELLRGCNRMIAGQVYDTVPETPAPSSALDRLERIHRNKTGALIRASCRAGAICGGASEDQLAALTRYAEAVGLMFQIVDDLMDVTQTSEHLGKTAGKDERHSRLTYPGVIGIDASRREIDRLRCAATASLDGFGSRARKLLELCDALAVRTK